MRWAVRKRCSKRWSISRRSFPWSECAAPTASACSIAPSCNHHVAGILDVSFSPAPFGPQVAKDAIAITRGILEQLDVTGVLCVEFFLTRDGTLLVNELAPRPHNSGHLTIDACVTSQFEQQLRSVCGLPLGSTEMPRPAAMANLLGDVWAGGEPQWEAALALPEVKLHLYGKSEPRPGRKMGHLTATAATRAGGGTPGARGAIACWRADVYGARREWRRSNGAKRDPWIFLIGLFKLFKGISLLIAGFGLLRLLHQRRRDSHRALDRGSARGPGQPLHPPGAGADFQRHAEAIEGAERRYVCLCGDFPDGRHGIAGAETLGRVHDPDQHGPVYPAGSL